MMPILVNIYLWSLQRLSHMRLIRSNQEKCGLQTINISSSFWDKIWYFCYFHHNQKLNQDHLKNFQHTFVLLKALKINLITLKTANGETFRSVREFSHGFSPIRNHFMLKVNMQSHLLYELEFRCNQLFTTGIYKDSEFRMTSRLLSKNPALIWSCSKSQMGEEFLKKSNRRSDQKKQMASVKK